MSLSKSRLMLAAAAILVAVVLAIVWQQRASEETTAENSSPPTTTSRTLTTPKSPSRALEKWKDLTNDQLTWQQRFNIARRIDTTASPEEIDHFYSLLDRQPTSGTEEAWWVTVNEIMEQLRKNGLGPERYTNALLTLIEDPAQHPVLRDYAIQHLTQWLVPATADESIPSEQNPEKISQSLQSIAALIPTAAQDGSTVAGTALMALVDASSRLPETTTTPIWNSLETFFSETIAGETTVPPHTRISVVQAAAILSREAHLPAIRSLATSEETAPSLRLSSIAALGYYAHPQDQAYLQSLSTTPHRYQQAARTALKRFAAN